MARPPITRANPYTPKRGKLAGSTFTSERQYRNALAREKGFRSWSAQQRAPKTAPRLRDVARLSSGEQRARERTLDAVRLMRHDGTLTVEGAARRAGTTVNAMLRYAAPALEKHGGRYHAKPYDRQARAMEFLTLQGREYIEVRDSRSRERIASYWNAVGQYAETGDDRPLRKFRGKSIRIDGRSYPFITDTGDLDRLGSAGELGGLGESIYRLAAA